MTTKTDDLIAQARERLAAIAQERAALDAEEQTLRRMLAAAEGQPEPAKAIPWPIRSPEIAPLPYVTGPAPAVPWRPVSDHGGMCACPRCCPPVMCGQPSTVS